MALFKYWISEESTVCKKKPEYIQYDLARLWHVENDFLILGSGGSFPDTCSGNIIASRDLGLWVRAGPSHCRKLDCDGPMCCAVTQEADLKSNQNCAIICKIVLALLIVS